MVTAAAQDEREAIAGKLTAAGVVGVTLDPRGALPNVLVAMPAYRGNVGVGGWSVVFSVEVATAPPGDAAAAVWLLEQTELVLATLGAGEAEPQTVTRDGVDVPAYVVAVTRSLTNPTC